MTTADPGAKRRVLIVEDEAPVCVLVSDLLRDEGYEPQCALSDKEAYAILQQDWRGLAALVVDINLGLGTTGFDVARRARRYRSDLPVVYITGASGRSVEQHGVAGGVLVTKPFDRDLLVGALREKLGHDETAGFSAP